MAKLPGMAPVPPPAVQSSIPSNDWEAFLDAWITLLGIRLNASDKDFQEAAEDDLSGVSFLNTFYQQAAAGSPGLKHGSKNRDLRKLCFLATRRYILGLSSPPEDLLSWQFLGNLCCCYPSSNILKTTLSIAWNRHENKISSSMEEAKALMIKKLSQGPSINGAVVFGELRRLTVLASVLPPCGHILMAGSDYLDTMAEQYQQQSARADIHKYFTANVYVGLISLLKEPSPNFTLLLDQLFSLKASTNVGTPSMKKQPTLLSDLVCSSDLLQRLENFLMVHPQKRGQDLLASLRAYQIETKSLHSRYQRRRKVDKGKGISTGPQIPEELHAHKMSLVSQVQDLFPDLGSAFVVRLLDVFNDNPETVVAHLLDDSLPEELQLLDRTEQLPPPTNPEHDTLAPKPTPPQQHSPPSQPLPTRKNIFDSDIDIADLNLSDNAKGKLHFGRADQNLTADEVLADRTNHSAKKAAILSALATFDSDDDERDDTYDVADVGGTIDAAATSDADAINKRLSDDQLDMTLFRAYKSNPGLFARDSATRRSQPRAALKRETNMTDEAIEGWALMLSRDSKKLARLEDRLAVDAGGTGGGSLNQPELASTSYRKPQAGSDDGSDEETNGATDRGGRGGRGRGRGRGRGFGQRGRGGAGQGGQDSGSPAAHQKKEQNKASRANHNRRQQRAKKIARGGGLPG